MLQCIIAGKKMKQEYAEFENLAATNAKGKGKARAKEVAILHLRGTWSRSYLLMQMQRHTHVHGMMSIKYASHVMWMATSGCWLISILYIAPSRFTIRISQDQGGQNEETTCSYVFHNTRTSKGDGIPGMRNDLNLTQKMMNKLFDIQSRINCGQQNNGYVLFLLISNLVVNVLNIQCVVTWTCSLWWGGLQSFLTKICRLLIHGLGHWRRPSSEYGFFHTQACHRVHQRSCICVKDYVDTIYLSSFLVITKKLA